MINETKKSGQVWKISALHERLASGTIDPMSANVIAIVYERLNTQNKQRLRALPLTEAASLCWKLVC